MIKEEEGLIENHHASLSPPSIVSMRIFLEAVEKNSNN